MRAYADTMMTALADHVPEVKAELIELNPSPMKGAWGQRFQTVLMPAKAWMQRTRAPDLWHVLDGSRAYLARAFGSTPFVVTVHDVIPWLQANGRFPGAPPIGAAALQLWRGNGREMRRAARLICVSDCTARDAVRTSGCAPDKAQVVPSPLRPGLVERVRLPSDESRDEKMVLHIGNNGFYKNRAGVLRIFAQLGADVARRLVMAGPAPTDDLLRLAHALELGDRVEWCGDPDDDALAGYYRRASVLLFPSLYEGFGWPVLEAMAFGLPVVASDRGSLEEVVGSGGVCFSLDDEAGFVAAVSRILGSPEAAGIASRRGLERAQDFSSAAFARCMHDAYLAATGTRREG